MHTLHAVDEAGACTWNRSFDPGPCYCQPSRMDSQFQGSRCACVVCVCMYCIHVLLHIIILSVYIPGIMVPVGHSLT